MNTTHWKSSIIKFLSAQTISLFGSSIVQYAIVWHITLTTSSGTMLMLSTLCGFLPQIVISLFAGVWIDTYNRKTLIQLSDSIIALSTLLLALLFLAGYQNMYLLLTVLMIRSAGTGIQTPAVNAFIPQIVPQEHLMRVQGIQSTLSSMMMFLSPAIAGAILSVTSLEVTLLIDVVTACIAVGITITIKYTPYKKQTETKNTYIEDIKNGFLYLKTNRFIKRLLLFQIIILILISPSAFLTPLMVSRSFGSELWRLTASEMTYSLGMILGGVLIASWGGFKQKLKTTLLAGGMYGAFMIGLGGSSIFLMYLVCNTLIGITSPCYNAPISVTIQQEVEPQMQGRIFSFMQIATSCALPFGMMIFGPLGDQISIPLILIVTGSMVVLLSICAWKFQYLTQH
ncbi:MFS transporter [Amedibacillus sp. YH-ame10]